jgi:L,D-transpeptidase ErfK/SrfK
VPGDFLIKIGARYGVDHDVIARDNGLSANAVLRPGQVLNIDNRHIVPDGLADGLLLNLPQRMLFHFADGALEAAYPIGVGRPSWRTPTGHFEIAAKEIDKPWIVPLSIQKEMRDEGKPVVAVVQPGPDNPLGKHWLGLSIPAIGIHGTIAPASIYAFRSHGCIRLHPDDIAALYPEVERGTPGEIIYVPLLMAEHGGRVFLEVHPDVYKKGKVTLEAAQRLAIDRDLFERIDWMLAETVIARHEGIARDVSIGGS